MLEPRSRILVTSLAALGVSLAVSLAVIGGQKSSGRSDLTERATSLVRTLKVKAFGHEAGVGVDPTDFLRPEDRSLTQALDGLKRLADAYSSAGDEIDVAQVEILGGGKARTLSPIASGASRFGRDRDVGARQIDWIRGADGRWYLDPAGL